MINRQEYFHTSLKIDDFTLEELIGEGGTSQVWKVFDNYGDKYALKIFSPQRVMNDIDVRLFRQEFEKMRQFHHDGVLRIVKYGEYEGRPYLVFDLCESSLMKRLREKLFALRAAKIKAVPIYQEDELAVIILQVAKALNYLHSKGEIHQDIKPDNILIKIDPDGTERYILSDFGVSTSIKETILRDSNILTGNSTGLTPDYAAPEQFDGKSEYATDVFALGVTIYELCTGLPPISNSNITTGMALHRGGSIPDLPPFYSVRFNKMVLSCLEKEPGNRATTDQLIECCEFYLRESYWPDINDIIPPRPYNHTTGKNTGNSPLGKYRKKIIGAGIGLLSLGMLYFLITWAIQSYDSSEKAFTDAISSFDYTEASRNYFNLSPEKQVKYSHLSYLFNDVEIVRKDDLIAIIKDINTEKKGMVNSKGTLILDMQYNTIAYKDPEIITAQDDLGCLYINAKGDKLSQFPSSFCKIYKSLAEFKKDKLK